MTARLDNRLVDAPMRGVDCRRCCARVEVRKSSWHQTSVQWDAAATAACQERAEAALLPGLNGSFFESCSALRESIREAALGGAVPVSDDGY
jgi:methylmalonyl-CoA mutase cobalamin-binding subunit